MVSAGTKTEAEDQDSRATYLGTQSSVTSRILRAGVSLATGRDASKTGESTSDDNTLMHVVGGPSGTAISIEEKNPLTRKKP